LCAGQAPMVTSHFGALVGPGRPWSALVGPGRPWSALVGPGRQIVGHRWGVSVTEKKIVKNDPKLTKGRKMAKMP
jgi:hypothetical protein